MADLKTKKHWLDQPGNVDRLFYGIVVLTCLASIPDILYLFQIIYDKHPKTAIEEIPVFYGLYSMISLLTLLVIAKTVRPFLKRDEGYYD